MTAIELLGKLINAPVNAPVIVQDWRGVLFKIAAFDVVSQGGSPVVVLDVEEDAS